MEVTSRLCLKSTSPVGFSVRIGTDEGIVSSTDRLKALSVEGVATCTTSLLQILLASVLVLIGYQSVILAMRTGEISFVAPFRYLSLIWSALLGLIAFGEVPDGWSVFGAAVVIASGIYTFYRESKRRAAEPIAQESEPRVPA